MKSSPTILFYEPYPMGWGGNFGTQRLFLERMKSKGIDCIVVSPVEGVALDRFREMGIECKVIPPPRTLSRYGGAVLRENFAGKLRSMFDLVSYNMTLARFFRERKVRVVYSNCVRAQMSVGLGALFSGVPTILYIKGVLANPIIDRLSFLFASKILFFCSQNRDDQYPLMTRWLHRKIDILRIGLDPKVIADVQKRDPSTLRRELGIDSSCLNAAVLAQLYPPKGQHFVIEALARLVPEFPNLRLYLVGDHVIEEYRTYRAELDAMISRFGLSDHVKFTGWRKDGLDIARLMDILIHPSLAEGFGRAVLEAMALGLPVIASRVGGLREIIRDGENGFLVDPGDVETITKRWRELILSPELRARLGGEARRAVYADYLIDDKVDRFSEICMQLAGGNHG